MRNMLSADTQLLRVNALPHSTLSVREMINAVPPRPLTRAEVVDLAERIRQLLADPDANLTEERSSAARRLSAQASAC